MATRPSCASPTLSRSAQPAELDLSAFSGWVPVELLGNSAFPRIGELPYFITLPGYGFYWFLLTEEAEAPSWHEDYQKPVPDLQTLVLPHGWNSLMYGGAEGGPGQPDPAGLRGPPAMVRRQGQTQSPRWI